MSTLAPPAPPAPAGDASTDLDAIAHLEDDWSIACEFLRRDMTACGATAAWWLICRECGRAAAECHACRVSEAATWAMFSGSIFCRYCSASVRKSAWRDLFLITPIGVRS